MAHNYWIVGFQGQLARKGWIWHFWKQAIGLLTVGWVALLYLPVSRLTAGRTVKQHYWIESLAGVGMALWCHWLVFGWWPRFRASQPSAYPGEVGRT